MVELEVLSPAGRQGRPVPVWALVVLGALTYFDQLKPPDFFEAVVVIGSLISGVALAMWLEERLYVRLSKGRMRWQLLITLGLIPAGILFAALSALFVDKVIGADDVAGAFFLCGLWVSGALFGTAVVLVIDLFGRTRVTRFASRIRLLVLGLVGTWSAFAALISVAIPKLVAKAVQEAPDSFNIEIQDQRMNAAEFQAYLGQSELPELIRQLDAIDLVSWVFIGAIFLLLIPAVISAASKLGEIAMERIHPLDLAMERVGAGDLRVRVEEGGAMELRRLAARFNQMVASLDLARRMEQAFGAYVSRPVLERIRAQHGALELPTLSREATVFFADVRGFTPMSERLTPEQVMDMLRRYYAEVLEIVSKHEGYVDKFIGDAVYVVFNGPLDQPDHVARGVRCALAIQDHVARLNAAGAFPEVGKLEIGVGVATGPVIAGNLGTTHSTQFSVLGDTVNLAARLSGYAPAGEIWVSGATAAAVPAEIEATALEAIQVKGKSQPVVPYRIGARPGSAAA